MALPTASFLVGLVIAFYLLTFVAFAVLRILTGISIQRIGFSSLRHIAYSPKDGLRVEIRGVGLQVHRPTFAQPTWLSIVIEEPKVFVDLNILSIGQQAKDTDLEVNGAAEHHERPKLKSRLSSAWSSTKPKSSGKFWARLIDIKNKVKRIHSIISWLRLVDVSVRRPSCVLANFGTLQLSLLLATVDTRRATVDRTRLFHYNKVHEGEQWPAEWTFAVRNLLFTPEGKDCIEILDLIILNVHGYLRPHTEGLRDASVSLKIGRLQVPYDELRSAQQDLRYAGKQGQEAADSGSPASPALPSNESKEPDEEGSVPQVLQDAKDFVGSTLRGIREVTVALGFIGISKRVDSVRPSGKPLYLNASVKEIGMDLYRLDPATPEHSMYFSRHEVAHQALVTALSLSLGIEASNNHPERLFYVPMTTATLRTTLPSKILQATGRDENLDLNSNVLFANLVVTSPSVDLDPGHLPIVLAAMRSQRRHEQASSHQLPTHRYGKFASRLLPRANIKLSVHEPVVRIALPPVTTRKPGAFDFDLLISGVSSISLDIDSAHNSSNDVKYNATIGLRIVSHRLYYQTTSRETHNLLLSDSLELKAQITSEPQLLVVINSNIQTFSLYLVRPEIIEGIRQIVHQLRSEAKDDKLHNADASRGSSPLRKLPLWLHHLDLQANDINVELAGVDSKLSRIPRGLAVHLETWTAEYKAHKDDEIKRPSHRRRAASNSFKTDHEPPRPSSPQPKARPTLGPGTATDGRRVAFHFHGLEGFIIESATAWEQSPFLSIPRAEVALTTSSDIDGSQIHVASLVKSVYLQYSLFRYYAIAVAIFTVLRAVSRAHPVSGGGKAGESSNARQQYPATAKDQSHGLMSEFISADLRVKFLQVKAHLPDDPNTMFQATGLQASRHRWHTPFLRSQAIHFYADTPGLRGYWSRVVSIKTPRVDFRRSHRRHGQSIVAERSLDVVAEAIRVTVPSQLVVHKIFDNFVNTAKTLAQVHHRFKTQSDEYILAKNPEGPKTVPRISLRTQTLAFEIEDAPFDWKIGAIFRAGLIEQKQRLAREEAFRIKCKALRGLSRPAASRFRSGSAQSLQRGRTLSPTQQEPGHGSRAGSRRRRSASPSMTRGRQMRYDKDGSHGLSGFAHTGVREARERLDQYNAQSWKKRIDQMLRDQKSASRDVRDSLQDPEDVREDADKQEPIMQTPNRPGLATITITDLTMTVDKPSFPIDQLPDFMHRIGKGLPKDTRYGLLIPMMLHFEVGELRALLRDYPLPLLHIPWLRPGQSPRLSSFTLRTDFVIAEEYRNFESTRDLPITVVPPDKMTQEGGRGGGFAVDVRRTVSPVKTYSEIKLEINTARDTRIMWGTSYQPAIQDTMQVIEGFTKPQVDPSEKVGFWDKIRLSFHSRINVAWTGGGDVHLALKGSRDPYVVTGHGAGFMMIWRNNVRLNINQDDDPCKFLVVDSGDYVLAIPDYAKYARRSPEEMASHARGLDRSYNVDDVQTFKKVAMKLSGKVQWTAGLVFERKIEGGQRSFDFRPHYDVTLKNPTHVRELRHNDSYDAFDGFRSHHINMSISVTAPSDREWTVSNLSPASNYNAVHLTPRFFTHFFKWWDLFSGIMSLPVHQGPLFPGTEKSGKKFGRHMATIKYSLLLSPLFISHVYIHKDAEEFNEDIVSATGLKMRLDSFMLDIHQRREEFHAEASGSKQGFTTTGIRINQALLDLVKADLRAISVGITGTSLDAVKKATPEQLLENQQYTRPVALSSFNIPDGDYSWIDVDDFVEMDWTLPHNHDPKTSILPLAYSPRFTYRRQTDHGGTISGDRNRRSPFGYEPTHNCIMSPSNDSRCVQMYLIKERLSQIEELLEDHNRAIGDQELHAVREVENIEEIQKQLNDLREHGGIFERKRDFLNRMADDLQRMISSEERARNSEGASRPSTTDSHPQGMDQHGHEAPSHENPDIHDYSQNIRSDHVSDFNNRFVVHNAQIKWGNALRNIMLRYIHQVSQRRGFVYYTSRRAVKFILDIIGEQRKAQSPRKQQQPASESGTPQSPMDGSDDDDVQARIEELLQDGKKFVDADDPEASDGNHTSNVAHSTNEDVSQDFVAQNTYHVRLVAPQIQLQSEKNPKAVVLVAARGMRMQVFQIMDKDRMSDDVSGLVQTRFSLDMDNLQFFVTSKQSFSPQFLPMYSGNSYGTRTGSNWPPWAPLEAMFDFMVRTYGFDLVVQRTSANLRYDKYNKLRLKYNDNVTEGKNVSQDDPDDADSRIDHLWVDFQQLRAICDSAQYYTMYIIVLDLLMYSEPLEKTRNERLEKIMLAADFSDLRGAPEMVMTLQDRIRALEEIKTHFHVHEKYLDRQGLQDRVAMEQDLASCEDELFFIMKAITTSQRRIDDRTDDTQANGVLHYCISASEIVWHLIKGAGDPLAEFQLRKATYERTDNSDGSNHNTMSIDQIRGLSLLKNAMYPEIISAFMDHPGHKPQDGHSQVLKVKWYQLEAIAGINVIDHFEVDVHPLRVQLDYETGRKLFEYIFPGAGTGEEGFSPFMVKHQLAQTDEEDEESGKAAEEDHTVMVNATKDHPTGSATGAGKLEHRLQPTRALPDYNKNSLNRPKRDGLGISFGERHRLAYLHRQYKSSTSVPQVLTTRQSSESLSNAARGRQGSRTPSVMNTPSSAHSDAPSHKRFGVRRNRSASADSRHSKMSKATAEAQSDDLTQMMNRASNYMTISYAKIPSVILCLSYKGKGNRNFEDVHQFVFRMPTLEYRNKTWSNLDLAMALKKDVIRALIHHTGAIINNKFAKHKYGKSQQRRLREIASSSVVLSSAEVSKLPSAASSIRNIPSTSHSGAPTTSTPRESSEFTNDYYFGGSARGSSEADYGSGMGNGMVHTDTLGVGLEGLRQSATPSIEETDEEKEDPAEASKPATFRRQFSELTQKAVRRKSHSEGSGSHGAGALAGLFSDHRQGSAHAEDANGGMNGHASSRPVSRRNSAGGGGDETTPRRSRLVKRIMAPLQRDKG